MDYTHAERQKRVSMRERERERASERTYTVQCLVNKRVYLYTHTYRTFQYLCTMYIYIYIHTRTERFLYYVEKIDAKEERRESVLCVCYSPAVRSVSSTQLAQFM